MDNSKRNIIKELNSLLRECEVGMSGYDKCFRDATNPTLRGKFESYKADYAENANAISQRITELGGNPKYGAGMACVISNVAYVLRGADGHNASELLRTAHYGETKNIDVMERVISNPQLDENSKELLRRQHSDARARQEELIDLIRGVDT